MKAGADFRPKNKSGDDVIDLAMLVGRFVDLVGCFSTLWEELAQSRIISILKRACVHNKASAEDVKVAVSFLDRDNILVFLEDLLSISRPQLCTLRLWCMSHSHKNRP
jgi:hypothetical protein